MQKGKPEVDAAAEFFEIVMDFRIRETRFARPSATTSTRALPKSRCAHALFLTVDKTNWS